MKLSGIEWWPQHRRAINPVGSAKVPETRDFGLPSIRGVTFGPIVGDTALTKVARETTCGEQQ